MANDNDEQTLEQRSDPELEDDETKTTAMRPWQRSVDHILAQERSAGRVWHRQNDETDAQFVAFQCFMRLEAPRSVVDAWRSYAPGRDLDPDSEPNRRFYDWARENEWRERAEAFDDECWMLELELRILAQRRVSAILTARSEDLANAAVDTAIDGSPQMLRDLLDRIAGPGLTRSKAKGDPEHQHTHLNQVNFDMTGMDTADLIKLAELLGPLLKSDDE